MTKHFAKSVKGMKKARRIPLNPYRRDYIKKPTKAVLARRARDCFLLHKLREAERSLRRAAFRLAAADRALTKFRASPRALVKPRRRLDYPIQRNAASQRAFLRNNQPAAIRKRFIKLVGKKRFKELCANPKWVRNIHDNMIIALSRRSR